MPYEACVGSAAVHVYCADMRGAADLDVLSVAASLLLSSALLLLQLLL
jgi:hypothetical protein